jgi:Phage integrase, N-terminal SAM-like domain
MKKCLVRVTNVGVPALRRPLTPAQFGDLAEIPPELEWLANLTNPKTRRAYKIDVEEFIGLDGIAELRSITRAHVIAWRKDLEKRGLAGSSIRRKLSALSALFDYMCEHNAVSGNPVDGVTRPMANGNDGSTPALGDAQARKLLEAPSAAIKRLAASWAKLPARCDLYTASCERLAVITIVLSSLIWPRPHPGGWSTMPSRGGLERRIGKLVQAPA